MKKTASLEFHSFDGGPSFTAILEDSSIVSVKETTKYSKANHAELHGAGFTVTFTFDEPIVSFACVYGIDGQMSGSPASVRGHVTADGKEVFTSPVMKGDGSFFELEMSIADARTLELRVDDVRTTGATALSCAKVLRGMGAAETGLLAACVAPGTLSASISERMGAVSVARAALSSAPSPGSKVMLTSSTER